MQMLCSVLQSRIDRLILQHAHTHGLLFLEKWWQHFVSQNILLTESLSLTPSHRIKEYFCFKSNNQTGFIF